MKRRELLTGIRFIILGGLCSQSLYYIYLLMNGVRDIFEILPSFLAVGVLICLFLGRSRKSVLCIQGILGIGILVEGLMLLTLLLGVFMVVSRLSMTQIETENVYLIVSLMTSIAWKVALMIACLKFPELINPDI